MHIFESALSLMNSAAITALVPDAGDKARLWGFILMGAAVAIAVIVIIIKASNKKK